MKVTIEIDTNELDSPSFTLLMKLLQQQSSYDVSIKQKEEDLGVLAGRPQSEISKLKLFMDIFTALSTNNGKEDDADIHKDLLFNELIATGRFTLDQCNEMLEKVERNGQIYQRRKDWYAKA